VNYIILREFKVSESIILIEVFTAGSTGSLIDEITVGVLVIRETEDVSFKVTEEAKDQKRELLEEILVAGYGQEKA
jgi:hypothetical protein